MNGMDNTTHQLHYSADDPTTQGQMAVPAPAAPGSPAAVDPPTTMLGQQALGQQTTVATPVEPASGRYPAPEPGWQESGWQGQPAAAHARSDPGRGRTTIADEVVQRVIQKIVDITVDSVDGVHGLRPGVDQFFGEPAGESSGEPADKPTAKSSAKRADRAVAVTLTDGQATINVSIEVEFGYAVHDVVHLVRTSVIDSAERLLGLTVAEVNVVVSDVSFDSDAAASDTAASDAAAPV